jgi:hypothetical protein
MVRELLYLSRDQVASLGLAMREIIASLEGMFREKERDGWRCRPSPAFIPVRMPSFTLCRLISPVFERRD